MTNAGQRWQDDFVVQIESKSQVYKKVEACAASLFHGNYRSVRCQCWRVWQIGEVVTTIPTIGFNVESVTYKNLNFNVWVGEFYRKVEWDNSLKIVRILEARLRFDHTGVATMPTPPQWFSLLTAPISIVSQLHQRNYQLCWMRRSYEMLHCSFSQTSKINLVQRALARSARPWG